MPDDRFYELASRYLDGATTDAEEVELSEKLTSDPDVRREMARLVNQHAALRWSFVPAEEATPLPQPRILTRRRSRRRGAGSPASSGLPWIGAAAAAVFLILVVAALGRPTARPGPTAPPVVVRPPVPEPTEETRPLVGPPSAPVVPEAPPRPDRAPDLPPPAPAGVVEERRPAVSPPPAPPSPPTTPEPATTAAPAPIAVLEAVNGAATLGDLAAGAAILADRVLATPAGVRARVRFPDGTRVELSPATDVALSLRSGPHIALRGGEILAEVEKQAADRP
ncbi:MAG TPA: FecR domain-containing protein, partial [Planctomycetota bacterium]|nr:FecR domain-containing protein [Planctomycetota bacterium]